MSGSRTRRGLVGLGTAAVLVAVLGGCNPAAPGDGSQADPIRVVAAENFWGDIAAQIGGAHVAVRSLLGDPNTDPHEFVSSPVDAAEVSEAQLVIDNGVGYDPWISRILSTGSSGPRRVVTVGNVLRIEGSDPNPHLWYWTARLPAVAAAIATQLSAIAPADAAAFRANADRFDASLRPLFATIATIRRRFAGAKISYTERVPGYLVQAAGLVLGTPLSFSLAIENGSEPSPADEATFARNLSDRTIRVLLYNSQVVDAETTHLRALAAAAGIPVVGVSETMPPDATNFQAWQLAQDRSLLTALERSR